MHVTDELGVKDVLELAGVIVMASSDKKKKNDSKRLKTIIIRMKSFSDNFIVKLMMRVIGHSAKHPCVLNLHLNIISQKIEPIRANIPFLLKLQTSVDVTD